MGELIKGEISMSPDRFRELHEDKIASANTRLTALVEINPQIPLYGFEDMQRLLAGDPEVLKMVVDVFNISRPGESDQTLDTQEVFTLVPEKDFFTTFPEQPYSGPNGRNYKRLTKYFPEHATADLNALIAAANHTIAIHTPDGDPVRPGLLIDSGYRSPWYQTIIILRMMAKYGIDEAFNYASLAGRSQHSDPNKPAVDFAVMGDANGNRVVDPTTGKPDDNISFENSLEFEAVLKHGPSQGFWLPYHPNPADPLSPISPAGIKVEFWHWQHVGVDKAIELMAIHGVYEAIEARKAIRLLSR